jgi:hypothetical protein
MMVLELLMMVRDADDAEVTTASSILIRHCAYSQKHEGLLDLWCVQLLWSRGKLPYIITLHP